MSKVDLILNETMESKYNDSDDEQPKKRLKKDSSEEVEISNFEENDLEVEESTPINDKYRRCSGCFPIFMCNQTAHMDPGGCMYIDDFISEPSDTEEEELDDIVSEEPSEEPSKKKLKKN